MNILKLGLAIIVLVLAFYFRTPFLARVRGWAFAAIMVVGLGLIVTEIFSLSKPLIPEKSRLTFLIVALASLGFSVAIALEVKFNLTKQSIINQDTRKLEKLGQHFVIGYRNVDELKNLISKRAIGGVFVTARNIKDKTKDEIKQDIQALQAIRRNQGLPPLWIATDQEGGIVSRLSPPLTQLSQLSAIIGDEKTIERKADEVIQYASTQGKELSEIGVNLNFAPVVDLNKGIISPKDKYSKIYKRAISTDKNVVAKVALWYCQTLEEYDVRCTIKHFPGLGRLDTDTHLEEAQLKSSIAELTRDDWVPFRELMGKSNAVTMLGHAKLMAVDTETPVSFSKKVVTGIIRNAWQHDGVLITDDFSMQAVYGSKDGLKTATVKAINAGVDLILIAYDTDLYYEAMDALLKAEKFGKLDSSVLSKSQKRLLKIKSQTHLLMSQPTHPSAAVAVPEKLRIGAGTLQR